MFVQIIQGRTKDAAGFRKQVDRWKEELMPNAIGFLGSTAGVTDDGRFIMASRFESQEMAAQNSDSQAQSSWWSETEGYLEDVTFHDCTECDEWFGGGSDDAGFVQVIQGRVKDRDAYRASMAEQDEDRMKERRPDIIGGVTSWHNDKDFTDVIYFTSEAEAREREKETSDDPEMATMMEQMDGDMTFYDLREPQLLSP
jgi:hypothetical protein